MSGGIICKMYKLYMTLYTNMSMPIHAVQGIEGNREHVRNLPITICIILRTQGSRVGYM